MMSVVLQHILALSLVALCVGYVGWQAFQAFRGKRSRVGSCCAKGCTPPAATEQSATPKVVYFPVEMLSRKRKA
jgi:hypothetical protein